MPNQIVLGFCGGRQVEWLETANVKFKRISLGGRLRGMWADSWLVARWRLVCSRKIVADSANTLESLRGVVFLRSPGYPQPQPECCDLSNFSALRYPSIGTDHQLELRLPTTLERLYLHLIGPDPAEAGEQNSEKRKAFSREWGMDMNEAPSRNDRKSKGARPTWAALLQGATGLRDLRVVGYRLRVLVLNQPRGPTGLGMALHDFQREWPEALSLRLLTLSFAYLPFELAVRDAEEVRVLRAAVFLTEATSAAGVLEALLVGRARTLSISYESGRENDEELALCNLFKWVGRDGGMRTLAVQDVINAAGSAGLTSRINVKLRRGVNGELIGVIFLVVARSPKSY